MANRARAMAPMVTPLRRLLRHTFRHAILKSFTASAQDVILDLVITEVMYNPASGDKSDPILIRWKSPPKLAEEESITT